jgi:hypothetical protein
VRKVRFGGPPKPTPKAFGVLPGVSGSGRELEPEPGGAVSDVSWRQRALGMLIFLMTKGQS